MKKRKRNKRSILLAAILLALTATVGTIGVTTFAKYTTQLNGTDQTATVAKWNFGSNSNTFTFDLVENKIAPGTQGKLDFTISNTGTDVGVNYDIVLTNTNAPTNIKFYSDSACTQVLTNNTLTGTLAPNAAGGTVTIYWKWDYETTNGDTADTTDGTNANTMTVTATITGTQVEPQ